MLVTDAGFQLATKGMKFWKTAFVYIPTTE